MEDQYMNDPQYKAYAARVEEEIKRSQANTREFIAGLDARSAAHNKQEAGIMIVLGIIIFGALAYVLTHQSSQGGNYYQPMSYGYTI